MCSIIDALLGFSISSKDESLASYIKFFSGYCMIRDYRLKYKHCTEDFLML